MWVVLRRFLNVPHVTLIASTAPVVIDTVFPAIKKGFVLALVVGAAKGEGVLGPDDECGPFATCSTKRSWQGIEFTGGHGDVHRTLGSGEDVVAGIEQEAAKSFAQVVVHDGAGR